MFDFQALIPPDNPVFAGGLGLGLLAAGVQGLRGTYGLSLILLKRYLLVTLEVTSKDRSYPWVLQWLTIHGKRRNQHISVETSLKPMHNALLQNKGNATSSNNIQSSSLFDFVPGPGQHFIWYNGTLMHVQRFREQQMLDLNTGKPWEKVIFTAFGKNTFAFENILHEALVLASLKEEGKTTVYTSWGTDWRPFGQPRPRRPLNSVILDHSLAESILNDVLEWKKSSKWYLDRGIPYRRGYLLHGPPGSGKSSFIMALAGHLNYNICILNLAERGLSDDRLAQALSCVPPQSIVLLEDIDAAFPSRQQSTSGTTPLSGSLSSYSPTRTTPLPGSSHSQSDVTFSGLLNVLDGVASSEERLLFMTTNHIERLDPALIRPGRVDVVHLIGNATAYQIRAMFAKFYMTEYSSTVSINNEENSSSISSEMSAQLSQLEAFISVIESSGRTVSMAQLQGHFMRFKHAPEEALSQVMELLKSSPSPVVEGEQNKSDDVMRNESNESHDVSSKGKGQGRGYRELTVAEVDRMVFNPQPDWDKGLKSL